MKRYAGSAAGKVVSHWPRWWPPTAQAAGRVQAWVVGPGLGSGETSLETLAFALNSDVPVIVDADALTILPTTRTCCPTGMRRRS